MCLLRVIWCFSNYNIDTRHPNVIKQKSSWHSNPILSDQNIIAVSVFFRDCRHTFNYYNFFFVLVGWVHAPGDDVHCSLEIIFFVRLGLLINFKYNLVRCFRNSGLTIVVEHDVVIREHTHCVYAIRFSHSATVCSSRPITTSVLREGFHGGVGCVQLRRVFSTHTPPRIAVNYIIITYLLK